MVFNGTYVWLVGEPVKSAKGSVFARTIPCIVVKEANVVSTSVSSLSGSKRGMEAETRVEGGDGVVVAKVAVVPTVNTSERRVRPGLELWWWEPL